MGTVLGLKERESKHKCSAKVVAIWEVIVSIKKVKNIQSDSTLMKPAHRHTQTYTQRWGAVLHERLKSELQCLLANSARERDDNVNLRRSGRKRGRDGNGEAYRGKE